MKIRVTAAQKTAPRAELLVVFALDESAGRALPGLEDAVREAKATGDLRAGFRQLSLFHPTSISSKRLLFVGLGKRRDIDAERLRRAAALAQQRAEELEVRELRLWLSDRECGNVPIEAAGRAIAEGLLLGAYRYDPPRREKSKARHGQNAQVTFHGKDASTFKSGFATGEAAAKATHFARDLGNMAANLCTPTYLASQARKMAGAGVSVRILERKDLERLKMQAFLGVARGSVQAPKLIVLDYRPPNAKGTVCVVGKGLTFDSGGISIKPSAKMDEMRYDMCGSAAVLGLFAAIKNGALRGARGKHRVVGVVAACENMPDAAAQKPGDVVTACDGTTIEILNTDAEGRLVLADALAWAVKTYKPSKVVDLATLTGAVVVALGHEVTGVMGSDDGLIAELIAAGKDVDEPLWQLPLWDVHKDQVKSKFADIANLNSAAHGGGSIAGGAFLSYFVGPTAWAHMDIAGTAWGGRAKDYYRGGASGVAVRTLVHWLRGLR
ncbi:MAG: leucyl aminopeptidase [Planctomycetota bacterium]